MAEGRDRTAWNHTAAIRHTVATRLTGERATIASFHPYEQGQATRGIKLDLTNPTDMEALALAMVPKYRKHRLRQMRRRQAEQDAKSSKNA